MRAALPSSRDFLFVSLATESKPTVAKTEKLTTPMAMTTSTKEND
jgi:hypothetical protein